MSITSAISLGASATTPIPSPSITRLSLDPGCFHDVWADIGACRPSQQELCTSFSIGSFIPTLVKWDACSTQAVGAQSAGGTECPVSYTPVGASTWTNTYSDFATRDPHGFDIVLNGVTTAALVTCCPEQYDFTFGDSSSLDASGSTYQRLCTAANPSLSDAPAPWTFDAYSRSVSPTPVLFTPGINSLFAPARFARYEIVNGTTCAWGCSSTGTHSNLVRSSSVDSSSSGPESNLPEGPRSNMESGGWKDVYIAAIVGPIVLLLLILGCWCWLRRSRKREKAAIQNGAGQTERGVEQVKRDADSEIQLVSFRAKE